MASAARTDGGVDEDEDLDGDGLSACAGDCDDVYGRTPPEVVAVTFPRAVPDVGNDVPD